MKRFPVIPITNQMILADDQMGSKDKFWCELPADLGGGRWLFKQPRDGVDNIEHVAEKIAQENADLIRIPCARIELAEFNGVRGTVSKNVLAEGEALVHGSEIIAGRVDGYNLRGTRRTSSHTFERIRKAINEVCAGRCEEDLSQFAGYIILDAVIGNTDRHHENWALLRRDNPKPIIYRLAPSFDHASSLGRELLDARRSLILNEGRLDRYIHNGAGGISRKVWRCCHCSNRSRPRTDYPFSKRIRTMGSKNRTGDSHANGSYPKANSDRLDVGSPGNIRQSPGAQSQRNIVSDKSVKTLFVAWKQKDPGGWHPVGRLDADLKNSRYSFRYIQGALDATKEGGFAPFDSFPSFEKEYVSNELFPFFSNRVQNPNRPSFREYLERLNLSPEREAAYDPIELLAVSEGRRATDNLEVFPKIERIPGEPLAIKFFVHGLRYCPQASVEAALALQTGEELGISLDVTNPVTPFAVQLQTASRFIIGYVPRYLQNDLLQVTLQCSIRASVARVNPPPAPPTQRVMVLFEGCWPEGYEPMSNPEFQPLKSTRDSEVTNSTGLESEPAEARWG